jgi:hypothetical protein
LAALPACSSDNMTSGGGGASSTGGTGSGGAYDVGAANPEGKPGDAQTPPTTTGSDVEAWLAQGSYKTWKCETTAHPQMKVSPHGQNKVCSNDLTAGFTSAVGSERPIGSAAVKELYNDSGALVGYAASVKIKATSDAGASWYWYERVPTNSTAAPHNAAGVVADGLGTEGGALNVCVGCHSAAGSNTDHTVLGSADFVYDQISQ